MPKINVWSTEEAQKELQKRLQYAKDSKRAQETMWEQNERIAYAGDEGNYNGTNANYSFQSDLELGLEDIDNSTANVNLSYAFKNLRFVHAQMSANPPSVVTRPTSNDPEDRRKADAADRVVRYAIRAYRMQERVDRASLNCLLYGTGFMKVVWDSMQGEIVDFDQETGETTLEGDISVTVPDPWNMYIDPDAENTDEIRWMIERHYIPYEEALYQFPDKKELLQQARKQQHTHNRPEESSSRLRDKKYDVVEIYEYYEKGLPTNAFLGKHCYFVSTGHLLTAVEASPHKFKDPSERYPKAELPYFLFTDIDVPNVVWGKSAFEFTNRAQQVLSRIDSVELDNAQAHGVARLVLPEGAEISDDSITNSPWDIIKVTGNQGPFHMNPPTLMPELNNLRMKMKQGIDDMWGVNEAMFGQTSRETSGFSMQYATNQGNMIRRRLFNKYVFFVEGLYRTFLKLVVKHWDTKRTIQVLGKEKALESVDLKGADVDTGYDLIVEYGASLSLDPQSRREEILSLMPIFEKAGVSTQNVLRMLKLNELEGLYDSMQYARDRQREIFEEIIATGLYLEPEPLQDHQNMLAYAMEFMMTSEFKYLDDEAKTLLRQHVRDRAALQAQEMQPQAPQAPGPAPEQPAGPLPDVGEPGTPNPESQGPGGPIQNS